MSGPFRLIFTETRAVGALGYIISVCDVFSRFLLPTSASSIQHTQRFPNRLVAVGAHILLVFAMIFFPGFFTHERIFHPAHPEVPEPTGYPCRKLSEHVHIYAYQFHFFFFLAAHV